MSPSSESDKTNQVAIGELYSAVVTMQIAPCETVFSPAIYSLRCYFYTTTITWNHQNGWNEFINSEILRKNDNMENENKTPPPLLQTTKRVKWIKSIHLRRIFNSDESRIVNRNESVE